MDLRQSLCEADRVEAASREARSKCLEQTSQWVGAGGQVSRSGGTGVEAKHAEPGTPQGLGEN